MYFRFFSLSQKKTNCYFLTHHTWKMSPHYLVKCTTFSAGWRYVVFLQTLVALKNAGCGLALVALKRTCCDVWQMECQPSNITANVQSDHLLHGYMLPVFLATGQLHRPHSVKIQPKLQQDASATHPYRGLIFGTHEKIKKRKNLCILQGSVVTFFRCGGNGVTVCFLLK